MSQEEPVLGHVTVQLLIALERGWEERRQPARRNLISTPEVVESVLTRTTKDCSIQLTSAQRIGFVIATFGAHDRYQDRWKILGLKPICRLAVV